MRFPLGPGPYRDRLLDAMAWLLVDLHRAGVYWGDCSLANTLFRRDGDKIQAYLVDAETSEIHPTLSDGQRAYDLDILVENVGFGLADLGAMQGREDAFDDAVEAAETVRDALPRRVGRAPRSSPSCRPATATPSGPGSGGSTTSASPSTRSASSRRRPTGDAVRLRVAVANRRFHARELRAADRPRRARGPGPAAAQRPARVPGLARVATRARSRPRTRRPSAGCARSSQPALAGLVPAIGPVRDPLQAYCDVLEEKWLLSEPAGRDVGLEAAHRRVPRLGAPAPEARRRPTARSRSTSTGRAASTATTPS